MLNILPCIRIYSGEESNMSTIREEI